MARTTGKDHSQINLAIWGDEAFLDLTPPAQHLFFVLWTSAGLSYCGTGEWHAGKIATRARGWTAAMVETVAVELNTAPERYLFIDRDTEEYLMRSWIKHDGICRRPNMAVSMANARADVASRTLRAVIVHEVAKIAKSEPDLSAWEREAVKDLLGQRAIDPATLPPYNPPIDPRVNPPANLWPNPDPDPMLNPPAKGYGHLDVTPPTDPGRTPAPAPAPFSISPRGSTKSGTSPGDDPDPNDPPPPRCPKHADDPNPPNCGACGDYRKARQRWDAEHDPAAARARRVAERAVEIAACSSCDPNGWLLDDDGPAVRCPAHRWETTHA